uniref:Mobile element protein n=1 Tax=Macrostomum lignano TaxID=282301 RepID=A0A1I8HU62_9PLAT
PSEGAGHFLRSQQRCDRHADARPTVQAWRPGSGLHSLRSQRPVRHAACRFCSPAGLAGAAHPGHQRLHPAGRGQPGVHPGSDSTAQGADGSRRGGLPARVPVRRLHPGKEPGGGSRGLRNIQGSADHFGGDGSVLRRHGHHRAQPGVADALRRLRAGLAGQSARRAGQNCRTRAATSDAGQRPATRHLRGHRRSLPAGVAQSSRDVPPG